MLRASRAMATTKEAKLIDAFINTIENFIQLSDAEKQLLQSAVTRVDEVKKGQVINCEEERPSHVHVVVEGWAYRYKYAEQGDRAIVGYLLPGDMSDIHITLLDHMDHSVGALTPAKIALIPLETIREIYENHIPLSYAFFWSSLISESILREWFVNNTVRPADKRVAHLLCEMLVRHQLAGLTHDNSFHLPLTQAELSDAVGITPVHTNRVLQRLRSEEMISLDKKRLAILDLERLMQFAEFSPSYLHLSEAYLRRLSN